MLGLNSCGSQAPGHKLNTCGVGLVALRHVVSSLFRDRTLVSPLADGATEPPGKPLFFSCNDKQQFF